MKDNDNDNDMLFCFCNNMSKTQRDYDHVHGMNSLPFILLYRHNILGHMQQIWTYYVAQNIYFSNSLSQLSNWDFILKYVLLWISFSSMLLLLLLVSYSAIDWNKQYSKWLPYLNTSKKYQESLYYVHLIGNIYLWENTILFNFNWSDWSHIFITVSRLLCNYFIKIKHQ